MFVRVLCRCVRRLHSCFVVLRWNGVLSPTMRIASFCFPGAFFHARAIGASCLANHGRDFLTTASSGEQQLVHLLTVLVFILMRCLRRHTWSLWLAKAQCHKLGPRGKETQEEAQQACKSLTVLVSTPGVLSFFRGYINFLAQIVSVFRGSQDMAPTTLEWKNRAKSKKTHTQKPNKNAGWVYTIYIAGWNPGMARDKIPSHDVNH